MCGIAGFFKQHDLGAKALSQETIEKMVRAISHRGPNSSGTWLDQGIALGHSRLAIHDLHPHAGQPMISQDHRYVLIFNGEIYNFNALRTMLENEHVRFKTTSDTEVLLALYAHKGLHETLNLIQGMFAFAIWDKKEKGLTLARDRIGKKPLYYGFAEQTFLFASELKAFKHHPEFKKEISPKAVNAYCEYGCVPGDLAIYQNTFKLLPGHYLSINSRFEIKTNAYWNLVLKPMNPDCNILAETKTRLQNAVSTRMASDVPLGAFLSGGIDSSLITAMMQDNSATPIHSFSIGFENSEFDESVYAEKIAQHLGTQHQTFIVTETESQAVIPSLTKMFDEPFADSSAIPTFLLAKLAKSEVSVALTGDGGDEVFAGYNRYRYANMLKTLSLLPASMRQLMAQTFTSPTTQKLLKNILFKKTPQFQQKAQKIADALSFDNEAHSYEKIVKIFNMQGQSKHDLDVDSDLVTRWQYRDLSGYLCDDVLTKVDRATMAVGLEARSPFLDINVVEWGMALPLKYKIQKSQTKWLLRQLLKQYVPENLFHRPKQGFAIPISIWLKGALKEWAEHLLFEVKSDFDVIDAATIQLLWDGHQSGQIDASQKLWTLLMWRGFVAEQ